jgi:predicted trehalose synthase
MLRSFDYAASSALDERAAIPPESRGALQPRNEDWRRAKQVFLAGYRAAIGDCPSLPRNEALYEICYGGANRSGHIPQAGVVKIIGYGK